jgi:hypothetical protein
MSLKTKVSKDRLRELFVIDLENGRLVRKKACGCGRAGAHAGYSNKVGYRIISVDNIEYFEQNLIWFLAYGSWPPAGYELDHKNRKKWDNRPSNLRLATRSQNNANMTPGKNNTTGYRGVYPSHQKGKYCVQVTKDGKCHSLGTYKTVEEAAKVASEARQKLFGEFACV